MNKTLDIITANSNPKVKMLNKLNKDSRLRRERDVFIVEGIRMFREIPVDSVDEIYMSESAYAEYCDEDDLQELYNAAEVTVMSDSVFAEIGRAHV